MKFCKDCNNFLYNITHENGKAFHSCRACPYKEEITEENPVIYDHDLHEDTSVQYSINPYLKYDPTLPEFDNMICKNEDCTTRGDKSQIVGIKLDSDNVTWLYQCKVCDAMWKQNAAGN